MKTLGTARAGRLFFDVVFGNSDSGNVVVFTIPPDGSAKVKSPRFFPVDRLGDAAEYANKLSTNVYFGVNPLRDDAVSGIKARGGRGKVAELEHVVGFVADIDIGDKPDHNYPPTRAEVLKLLNELPMRPSLVVSSGSAGLHVYWLFDMPQPVSPWLYELSRGWQGVIRSRMAPFELDATHDFARVLRVPGSIHAKTGNIVEAIEWEPDRRYSPDQFLAAVPKPKTRPKYQHHSVNLTDDIELAQEALAHLGPNRLAHYSDWLPVGMALRTVSDSLLPDFEAWSQQADGYHDRARGWGKCTQKWRSFTPGKIGLGSLLYWAEQDSGWKPPRKRGTLRIPLLLDGKRVEQESLAPPELPMFKASTCDHPQRVLMAESDGKHVQAKTLPCRCKPCDGCGPTWLERRRIWWGWQIDRKGSPGWRVVSVHKSTWTRLKREYVDKADADYIISVYSVDRYLVLTDAQIPLQELPGSPIESAMLTADQAKDVLREMGIFARSKTIQEKQRGKRIRTFWARPRWKLPDDKQDEWEWLGSLFFRIKELPDLLNAWNIPVALDRDGLGAVFEPPDEVRRMVIAFLQHGPVVLGGATTEAAWSSEPVRVSL